MPTLELTAADGHRLQAHRADPEGAPRGGVVVVQEIFGVNRHIRQVTERFAADGWLAVAPALFDRVERGVELGYDEEGFARGRALVAELDERAMLADLAAARDVAAAAGRVGLVGYCFGGALVWVAAGALDGVSAAVSYYGSRITRYVDRAPRVPVLLHVGAHDPSFPLATVREVADRYRTLVVAHEYDAGHGFNCDHRADYDASAATLARARTQAFLAHHLAT